MAAKKQTAKAVQVRLVHRFDGKGLHRLELHSLDRPPALGAWAGFKEVAVLESFRATSEYFKDSLPGVFRVSSAQANLITE